MNTAPFKFQIAHQADVTSTQDEVLRLVRDGAPSGTVLMADRQTKGRGRQGRAWETPTGNLAATLAWQYDPQRDRAEDYSLIVAVAMHWAVACYLKDASRLQLKWPNDLMLAGRKCAGILIEAPETGWLLIGTGVNLAYAPDDRTKVHDYASAPVTPRQLLDTYLDYFWDLVGTYRAQGLVAVVDMWRAHAYGMDQAMTVRLPNDEFTAVFRGLDDDGAARAELADGTIRRVRSGEVFF